MEDVQARILEEQVVAEIAQCVSCQAVILHVYECPRNCAAAACSLACVLRHQHEECPLAEWVAPLFIEVFGGDGAPLSIAMARGKVAVQWPLGLRGLVWTNPFVPRGHRLDAEETASEHYSLGSDAMAWQPEAQCGDGQEPVRSQEHPLGMPWLENRRLVSEVREINAQFIFALRRLEWRLLNWGFACIELPASTWSWEVPLARRLFKSAGVFLTFLGFTSQVGSPQKVVLVHNCPALHAALHLEVEQLSQNIDICAANKVCSPSFCAAYAGAMAHALKELDQRSLPMLPSLQRAWLVAELAHSTKRLAGANTAHETSALLGELIHSMSPGRENDHLRYLLRLADHRGGEIRLHLMGDHEPQAFPYPSFAWKWKAVQSYSWQHEQHINILEFVALFNYLRSLSNKRHLQHLRLFHVLDSRAVCGACSKGRSSARRLNRCSRRLLPFLLGMDWYLVLLWTISRWQFADQASRLCHNGEV